MAGVLSLGGYRSGFLALNEFRDGLEGEPVCALETRHAGVENLAVASGAPETLLDTPPAAPRSRALVHDGFFSSRIFQPLACLVTTLLIRTSRCTSRRLRASLNSSLRVNVATASVPSIKMS